ncbi:MAG TPA: hypothetical protein VLT36_23115, partial [Candidatus Dormibacteraeota bacterium]|nr:hypothetical protein [Candidatus Dormibacteraeota bacterium]
SRSEACKYTEAQWEPEPDRTVNDEDYAAWEDRNPGWRLHKDLGVFLDSDFIENIDGGNRYTHLEGMLAEKSQISLIEDRAGSGANTLVLIFTEALGGFEAKLASTPKLTYCGEYECKR